MHLPFQKGWDASSRCWKDEHPSAMYNNQLENLSFGAFSESAHNGI